MSKYTQEPWVIGDYGAVEHEGKIIQLSGFSLSGMREAKPNAARIVACINALAGIDDPEAFMRKVRELWDDNEVSGEIADVFDEHLKGATK